MNVLFVCSRNKWRSPTAEKMYKNSPDLQVRSAGTEPSARRKVSSRDVEWAEVIFVMEKKHKQRLMEKYPVEMKDKRITVLDITDDYAYMDQELMAMIKRSVDPIIML